MGGSRAAFRHLGPAHLESPGPGPESPMVRGDFAEPRQAEARWSRLRQGSRHVLAMVAARGRRDPQPGYGNPPGVARAVAGPPLLSHGNTTLPLAPFYSNLVPMGRLLKPQRPSLRVPRRGLLPVLEQGTETPENGLLPFPP